MNLLRRYVPVCLVAISVTAASQDLVPPPVPADLLEVLQSHDSLALDGLARRLVASRAPEGVAVLAWMLEHRPAAAPEPLAIGMRTLVRITRDVPVDALSRTLRNGNADQRRAAAIVLSEGTQFVPDARRPSLEDTLLGALSDPSTDVRGWVIQVLDKLQSPRVASVLADPATYHDLTRQFARAGAAAPQTSAALPPNIGPDAVAILKGGDEAALWKLIDVLGKNQTRESATALTWILANANASRHGERVARLLAENHPRTGAARVADIAPLLATADAVRRRAAAFFFERLFAERNPRLAPAEKKAAVGALISALADPNDDVRRVAAEALGRARARESVDALVRSLQGREVSQRYATMVFSALQGIGDRRAVPELERWARMPREFELRMRAAWAVLEITKPADPGATIRELLWEQPDTALERDVLSRGKAALPAVWSALAQGPPAERRAALALVGWFRDLRSIPHILTALEAAQGALTRQQLLFDLNAILLTEAPPLGDRAQIDEVASQHLVGVFQDIATNLPPGTTERPMRCENALAVYPGVVSSSFRVEVGTGGLAATVSESADAFNRTIKQTGGCGVAFHVVRSAEGTARVASTLFLLNGSASHEYWITVHRQTGARWTLLPFQPHGHRRTTNEPNLRPAIERNYGARDPLKVVRLDSTMEKIRVDYPYVDHLYSENADVPYMARPMDASYLPLLARYRGSDNANLRHAVEFAVVRLGSAPNVDVLIEALRQAPTGDGRVTAHELLSRFMDETFTKQGRDASDQERADLIRAVLAAGVDPTASRGVPEERNIASIRRWQSFALARIHFGGSGYSMLFEQRDGRWTLRATILTWIS